MGEKSSLSRNFGDQIPDMGFSETLKYPDKKKYSTHPVEVIWLGYSTVAAVVVVAVVVADDNAVLSRCGLT